ncbi:MAG: T9SS type A sorting domain-containing protein, partial [Bacteroidota bacterium]
SKTLQEGAKKRRHTCQDLSSELEKKINKMKKSIKLIILFAVLHFTASAQYIYTVAGEGGIEAFTGDSIEATLTRLGAPRGVNVDASGNVYIGDGSNCRIRKVLASTGFIYTIVGTGTCGHSGDSGVASLATIGFPRSVKFDAAHNLYFSENLYIRKVDAVTNIITTIAGTGSSTFNGDNILAVNANIVPRYIDIDYLGNIYFADGNNSRIRKIDASTGIITTIAGTGSPGYTGDSGLAINARICNNPEGIALDANNNIYIGDYGNNCIRRIDHTTGIITTVAGTGVLGYNGDNILATDAQLNHPYNVCFDLNGNLLIGDGDNFRIRKIDHQTGIITTFAGNGNSGYCCDNVLATSTPIATTYDLCFDIWGNEYHTDGNRIRKITALPTGNQETKLLDNVVSVYPNPATNSITIHQDNYSPNEQIIITDIMGHEVYKAPLTGIDNTIELTKWSSGVYFYEVRGSGLQIPTSIRGKFIKE